MSLKKPSLVPVPFIKRLVRGAGLAAATSAAAAAIIIGPLSGRYAKALTVFAAVAALISFGPQKYFDAQFALIWPAVLSGQLAVLIILTQVLRHASLGPNRPATVTA
ncbi:hypothetical protein [Yoonia sp. SDW83-1]|uniref:hypothetical protein n=1 Tax=Yoonia sp. SDW83-1 TaxID=3366945 RepID=UPI00398C5860